MYGLIDALRSASGLRQTVMCGWDFQLGAAPTLRGIDLRLVPVTRKGIHRTGMRAIVEFLWRGGRALRALDPASYDVIHFHFSMPTGLLAAVARNKPFVCSLHGIDVTGFVQEEAVFQALAAPLNRQILRRAALLFAPSRQLAEMVRSQCPEARVEVIPHGVEAEIFLSKNLYPPRARRFVTVARLTTWKRVELLVQAVIELRKTFPDVTLAIFGDGERRSSIEGLIRAAGAVEHITLQGFVPRESLQNILRTYDAFVLPSISESFGLVFLEAMAAGLPVIGFNYGGPAEIITPEVDGLLVKYDTVPALLEALKRLAMTPGLAEQMGRNARLAALTNFSWRAISQRYLAGYELALATRS